VSMENDARAEVEAVVADLDRAVDEYRWEAGYANAALRKCTELQDKLRALIGGARPRQRERDATTEADPIEGLLSADIGDPVAADDLPMRVLEAGFDAPGQWLAVQAHRAALAEQPEADLRRSLEAAYAVFRPLAERYEELRAGLAAAGLWPWEVEDDGE